ncbi:MAG: isoprenyl transferase [Candidatus Omnitrophica bacterium]|nr:isoprenyl transferase [Candidatus Omnitrophota bacterium]
MIDKDNFPKHIAIIMDGNGRWAKERGLRRSAGHKEGLQRVKEIIKTARKIGIKVLTLFAFSSENWDRPKSEINILMRFLANFLKREINKLDKNDIRLKVIGREKPLAANILDKIKKAEEKTKNNKSLTLVLALNYGSRQEIVDAVKKVAAEIISKRIKLEEVNEEVFSSFLYTAGLPDPDLLIRTSGELRISNFLLWQTSYSEFYFSKKYWPDFKSADFLQAIKEYKMRERRFGKINV